MWFNFIVVNASRVKIGGLRYSDTKGVCVVGGPKKNIKSFQWIVEACQHRIKKETETKFPSDSKIKITFYYSEDIKKFITQNELFDFISVSSLGRTYQ